MERKLSHLILILILILLAASLVILIFVIPDPAVQENAATGSSDVDQDEQEADELISGLLSFADAFIERRTAALIGTEKMVPELALDIGIAYESTEVFAVEVAALAELNVRRDLLREGGEAYTRSLTELTLVRADIKSHVATIDVEEFTKLYYARIRGDEPEYTAWQAHRRFIFAQDIVRWILLSQELINDTAPAPINEPKGGTND